MGGSVSPVFPDTLNIQYKIYHPLFKRNIWIDEFDSHIRGGRGYMYPIKKDFEDNQRKDYESKIPSKLKELKKKLKVFYNIIKRTTVDRNYLYDFELKIWDFIIEKGFKWSSSNCDVIYDVFEKDVRTNWSKHSIDLQVKKKID